MSKKPFGAFGRCRSLAKCSAIAACLLLPGCVFLLKGPSGNRLTGKSGQRFYGTFLRGEPDGSQSILHIYPNGAGRALFICLEGVSSDPARCEKIVATSTEADFLSIGKEIYADFGLWQRGEKSFGGGIPFPYLHAICKLEKRQNGDLSIRAFNDEYIREALASGQLRGRAESGEVLGVKFVTVVLTSNSRELAAFLLSNATNPRLWGPPLTFQRASVRLDHGDHGARHVNEP